VLRASAAGLTKVPIDGQPLSIVQDLEEMCRQYIKVRLAQHHMPSTACIAAAARAAAEHEHAGLCDCLPWTGS